MSRKMTKSEAIANLNHIYGIVSPDIQRSLDLAIKALEERPQGELISRSALKEDIVKLCRQINASNGITVPTLAFTRVIDNAPTVDIKDIYQEGHYDGHLEGYTKAINEERPQGEWENDSDNLPICNKCGEIALQRIFVKMPHLIQDVRMVRSNYCPNCGADMRKGGAE